jgi:membrane associated rhomboid family serine protease
MKLLLLQKCSFASSFVFCVVAHGSWVHTRLLLLLLVVLGGHVETILGAWVLVNAKALGPQEGS